MHGMRHFCVSGWLQHGVNIKNVSAFLGHTDPVFMLEIYTHLMDQNEKGARDAFNFAIVPLGKWIKPVP